MHGDGRNLPGIGEAPGERGTGQQCPHQTGACGVSHALDRGRRTPAGREGFTNQRQEPAHVVARGELGHHAAVRVVQRVLAVKRVREQAGVLVQDGDRTLVTRGFDA